MSTTGHETEVIQVQGLKESLKDAGNKAIFNEATCSTAGGTAAKVTNTVPPSFSLVSGATIIVKFTYAISVAGATLNVGETGAKPIYYRGAALPSGLVAAGAKLLLRYNGTAYEVIGNLSDPTLPARVEALEAYFSSSADSDAIINKWQEIVAFLNGISESDTLSGLLRDISGQIPTALSQLEGDATHRTVTDTEKAAWGSKQDSLNFNTPYNASTNKAATMADVPTAMSASGTNHKGGLVPDPGATQGTTKFLREDGSWQVPAYPTIEDFHEAVATLQSAPTSSTLTYQRDGKTFNYKVGDEVRVYDSENGDEETNNYVFYKLYDLVTSGNTTTAYWALAGAGGGGGSVMGKIRVNLRAYVNDVLSQGTDLNGVEVTLTNTTNSEVVGTQTWAGTTLIFNDVTPMKAYSISVSAKTGYTQPAAQTIAELPFSADETLSFDYEADEYTASIQSNQGTDSGISSAQITIAGTALSDGGTVKVAKGTTITPTATDITGYRKTVSTSGKIVTALYETEILSLTVSADDSSDVSAQQVTVTDTSGSSVLGTLVSGQTLKIAYGTVYRLSAASLNGYTTPTDVTVTAGQTSRSVAMEYVYNPIEYAYVTFNQTQSGDTAVIDVKNTQDGPALTCPTTSGATHPNAAIQAIRDASHLYMGKQTAAGKQLLCQLSDSNGGQYTDGSTAKFDGSEGDHWMRIGVEVYIKRVSGADSGNTVVYGIAVGGQPDSTWKQIISPSDLLAVHEAYIESSKLYSRSGVQSGANQTRDTFKTYARNRNASGTPTGKGYSCVTWEWHCMMALLFYAWYGRTNCQAQCGTGASSYTRTLGAKNSLGMTDTTASNGNADDVKFWGIENWWGDKYEWVDNVDVNDLVWTVKDLAGNSVRTSMTAGSSNGWINKLLLSENLDLIPTGVGGAETTYYCDYYYQNSGSRVVARSGGSAYSNGGVACVDASRDTSYALASIVSRLAFKGEIEIAESVAAFKAASSVG